MAEGTWREEADSDGWDATPVFGGVAASGAARTADDVTGVDVPPATTRRPSGATQAAPKWIAVGRAAKKDPYCLSTWS